MEPSYNLAIKLFTALAIGLLIGIERGWSDREESEGDRIAGIRTFSLIGLLGGVSALISTQTTHWFIAAVFLGVSALIICAHILEWRANKDVGTTTAFAMMLSFVLAAWAVYGHPIPAIAVTVVVISLLGYKPVLHSWLRNIKPGDFFAGVKLLVISLVLLPLLPNRGYGPWEALNPYWTWWMVVLISAISFLGYIFIQIVGEKKGVLATSIGGGLVSSTAVTFSLARFAREQKNNALFAGGVLLASAIMFIRVVIEVLVVHPELLRALWMPLTTMFAGLILALVWVWRSRGAKKTDGHKPIAVKNPLQLGMALQFGLLLAAVLFLSEAMKEWFGSYGVYALSIISGLIDVDAIALSLSRSAKQDLAAEVAVLGIILACLTNTLVKGVIFAFIAGFKDHFRLPLLMLAAMVPGCLVALALL
ncbi:MAG: MgtC/SapB family protein [Desulfotignum sp.]|nr:MgtC/SapB family protein [Desulfobacteraceae bacterium]